MTAPDLARLAIHTRTTKHWSLRECCERYSAAGVGGIGVWRELIDPTQGGVTPAEGARMIVDHGLRVPSLVRAGFFVSNDASTRQAAMDDARDAIADASTIGAEQVVLVVGASTGVSLEEARSMVSDAIVDIADDAAQVDMKLSIEPLHPMYASDRSCVNTLASANDLCDKIAHPQVGVAVDVYHLWWETDLAAEIARAGRARRIFGFHLCDWRTPTRDLLTDRGLMGDGCIDLVGFSQHVERAGFDGFQEVEIFSDEYWAMDQDAYLALIVERYRAFDSDLHQSMKKGAPSDRAP
jgi:sugar phosphate isomerase/epimerase